MAEVFIPESVRRRMSGDQASDDEQNTKPREIVVPESVRARFEKPPAPQPPATGPGLLQRIGEFFSGTERSAPAEPVARDVGGAADAGAFPMGRGLADLMVRPAAKPLLERPSQDAAQPPLIDERGAPVSRETFDGVRAHLASMPRRERYARMQAPGVPAWMRDVMAVVNTQLDASERGAETLAVPGVTVDSRAEALGRQGAEPRTAQTIATIQAQRGMPTLPLPQATAGPESLLTGEEERAARDRAQEMQKRGMVQRGMFAAQEGLVGSTAGLIGLGLQALGDKEGAKIYEKVGQAAAVTAQAADELTNMRGRAMSAGTIPAGLLGEAAVYMERMGVGAANSVGQMLPGLVGGVLTGNPAVGIALASVPTFGASYVERRSAGGSPAVSAAYAGLMFGFEALGETIGVIPTAIRAFKAKAAGADVTQLPGMFERFIAGLEKRGVLPPTAANIIRWQAGEQAGEAATFTGQYLLDGTKLGLDQPITLKGFLEGLRDTAVQTALATGAIEAGVKAARIVGGERDKERPGETITASTAEQEYQAELARRAALGRWADELPPLQPPGPTPTNADGDDAPLAADDLLGTPLDERAHDAATSPTNDRPEPTQAQKEAGNYKLGHVKVAGLDISVENPQGSVRRGVDRDGKPWESEMAHHYGYIRGTVGRDKDHIDVFVRPGTPEDFGGDVFVVDQKDPGTGRFDEHKVMLGFGSRDEAEAAYRSNYDRNWDGMRAITTMPMQTFKDWLASGQTTRPVVEWMRGRDASQPDMAKPAEVAPEAGPAGTPVAAGSLGAVRSLAPDAAGRVPDDAATAVAGRAEGVPVAGAVPADQALGSTTAAPSPIRVVESGREEGRSAAVTFKKGERVRLDGETFVVDSGGKRSVTLVDSGGAKRVITADAPNWAKLERAPKPTAAQRARRANELDEENDSLLVALAKMGGISRDSASKFGLAPEEARHSVTVGGLNRPVFRAKGGMSLDAALASLREMGFFLGIDDDIDAMRALEEAIRGEMGGSPTYTAAGQMARARREYEERMREEAERDRAEVDAMADEEARLEREAIMSEAGLTEEDMAQVDDLPDTIASNDIAAGMRAMGFTEQEIADEIARQARGADQAAPAVPEEPAQPAPPDADRAEAAPQEALSAPRPPESIGETIDLRKRVAVLRQIKECLNG